MPTETRPNPDALLPEVRKQESRPSRGKLKGFLSRAADRHVITGDRQQPADRHAPAPRTGTPDWKGYAWAVGVNAVATVLGWLLFHYLGLENENVLMLYLLGVLWVATRHTRSAAILASVLGVAAFDFCFVHPYLTFVVSEQQYLVTFVVMLVTALVISTLTYRIRMQTEAARDREHRTQTLLTLTRELAAARTVEEIVSATVRQVSDVLAARAVVLLPDVEGRLLLKADSTGGTLDDKEHRVAHWAFEHQQPAGRGTATLPAAGGTYVPMRASRGAAGVLGVLPRGDDGAWSAEQRQMVEAFASQAALAVERAALAEEARAAWERVEAEFLRNTLLSGVSHDLRTPLAAITGAVSSLIETGDVLPPGARAEMLDTIDVEAERMERLVNNLLDMTRLEAGGLVLKKEWQPLQEAVGSALHHLDRRLRGREVHVHFPPDLPLLYIDGVAVEQVLVNLLDNALEYTPASSPVEIVARVSAEEVVVEVADRGPGLPPGAEARIFDKFFRAPAAGAQGRRGIGLGLAICRGIVEAHGGRISASQRPGGGAAFRFTLPLSGTPPAVDSSA